MDILVLIPFIVLVVIAAFNAGQWSKENPSEEEMMRRIIQSRIHRRIRAEVETAVADEINRQAAHS